ncbi:MAG: DUF4373 domain-containing protein [Ruminococcus sp.]|nr:DUF4373 domain-containing protein [Ruminococcus sp.]
MKKGLTYFALDVDIFEDDKIFDLQNEYGPLGEVIYVRLLCFVYKNGYYYRFESLDKLAAMLMRSIGNRWAKDKKTVKEVILYLAKINLFSSELMLRNVITSRSIQERYLIAVGRRRSKIAEYCLIEKNSDFDEGLLSAPENPVSVAETPVNVTETSINVNDNAHTKVNKTKVNKSKVVACSENSTVSTNSTIVEFGTVKLTQQQHDELVKDFGSEKVEEYIKRCDEYQQSKGRQYSTNYETIRKWIEEDKEKEKKKEHSDGFDPEKYKCLINNI